MAQDFRNILVPKDIEAEVEIFVNEVKRAAAATSQFNENDIELIKPELVQLGGVELLDSTVVHVALGVAGWVTTAWANEYVLPVLKKVTRNRGTEFMHWLENVFMRMS